MKLSKVMFWVSAGLVLGLAVGASAQAGDKLSANGFRIPAYLRPALERALAEAPATRSQLGAVDSLGYGDLIFMLSSGNPRLQSAAAYALGETRAREATMALVVTLGDNDPQVRRIAAKALGKIGDPRAVVPLDGLLLDESQPWHVRRAAARALGMIGDKRAAGPLESVARREKGTLQSCAYQALQKIRRKG